MPSKPFIPTTVMSDALEVPAAKIYTLIGIESANVTVSATDAFVTIQHTDASDGNAVTRLVFNQKVEPGDRRPANVFPFVMETGDKIRMASSANNSIECILTWSEGDI